ncbi:MAG: PQQ-dependent sugar dehydrogenase [Luteolibacter sp.]
MSSLRPFLLAALLPFSAQAQKVERLYSQHCASCHGANLEGGQASALDDGIWKYGGSDSEIYRSIAKGIPDMGMVPWEGTLKEDQIQALVIFMREKEKQAASRTRSYPVPSPDRVTETELHRYRVETLVTEGLKRPWAIAFLPDGSKLVTERPGRLRLIHPDGKLDPKPIDGLPEIIEHGQGGLMEVAIHPDYQKNGWIYLGFNEGTREGVGRPRCITAIVRGRIKDHRWTDQQWIYRPDPKFRSTAGVHFGTRIVFKDGYLWFPIGERGGMMQAQDLGNPVGKIFRLHDDGRVPGDNPFVNTPGAIPAIWSYGHRNPQGLAIDPRDGTIFSTEHGPRGGDELNLIKKGANYGWPVVSYGMNYNGTPLVSATEKPGIENPVTYWVPSIAVCGLDFYQGKAFPKWNNDLFSGALAQQEVRRLRIENGKAVSQEIIFKNFGRVRDVATGPDGFLYITLNEPDWLVRLVPEK